VCPAREHTRNLRDEHPEVARRLLELRAPYRGD